MISLHFCFRPSRALLCFVRLAEDLAEVRLRQGGVLDALGPAVIGDPPTFIIEPGSGVRWFGVGIVASSCGEASWTEGSLSCPP